MCSFGLPAGGRFVDAPSKRKRAEAALPDAFALQNDRYHPRRQPTPDFLLLYDIPGLAARDKSNKMHRLSAGIWTILHKIGEEN